MIARDSSNVDPSVFAFLLIYLFLLPANNNLLLSILLYVVVYSRHKMAMMVRFCQTSERICEVDAEILGSSLTDKHLLPSCFVFFNSKCNVPIPAPSHFYFVIVLNGLCASLECRIALKKMLLLLCECVCVCVCCLLCPLVGRSSVLDFSFLFLCLPFCLFLCCTLLSSDRPVSPSIFSFLLLLFLPNRSIFSGRVRVEGNFFVSRLFGFLPPPMPLHFYSFARVPIVFSYQFREPDREKTLFFKKKKKAKIPSTGDFCCRYYYYYSMF